MSNIDRIDKLSNDELDRLAEDQMFKDLITGKEKSNWKTLTNVDHRLHNLIDPGEIYYCKILKAYWICTGMVKNFYRGILSKADIEAAEMIDRPELADDIKDNFKVIINDIEFDITRLYSVSADKILKCNYIKEKPAKDVDINALIAKMYYYGRD